ncbi:MAG: hypothetical protein K8R73_13765 [Clostridiales bacterium]|nr:hypothetical protein [Clostridiales bacterium]
MNSYDFLSESNQYFSEADMMQFCQTKKYQVFAYKRLYILSNNVDYLHSASDIFKNSTMTKLLADDSIFKNDFLVYKADLFYMIGKHFLFIDRSISEEYYIGAYQIIMKIPKYSRDAQLMKILEEISELVFQKNDKAIYQFRA